MAEQSFLTTEEVSERYRGQISVGTLRNWRTQRVGPPYIKIGKSVLTRRKDWKNGIEETS